MHVRLFLSAWLLAILMAGCSDASATASYSITDLGNLGGGMALATSINDEGAIAGYSYSSDALVLSNGKMTDLGTLSGYTSYTPYDINQSGQVAGSCCGSYVPDRAFLYSQGILSLLPTPSGHVGADAYAMNDNGLVVGKAGLSNGYAQACIWQDGNPNVIAINNAYMSWAAALNNAGTVAGISYGTGCGPWIWRNGSLTFMSIPSGIWVTDIAAINDSEQVVVRHSDGVSNNIHSYLWQNGTMLDLGTLGGIGCVAKGMNDLGDIVGWSNTADGAQHPFIWSSGFMQLLPLPTGYTCGIACSINDKGQIVGSGSSPGGPGHAFLWTPVPEPSTLLALLCGIGGLGRIALRRRKLVC